MNAPSLQYETVDNLRALRGYRGHWFDPNTLRFFSSRIDRYAVLSADGHAGYFVSSERDRYGDQPRRYSVRCLTWSGVYGHADVDTVGRFQQYATKRAALLARDRAARATYTEGSADG